MSAGSPRLGLKDVEASGEQSSARQRVDQRILVHQTAACCIGENRAIGQQRQSLR
jgi:hypothetical protein